MPAPTMQAMPFPTSAYQHNAASAMHTPEQQWSTPCWRQETGYASTMQQPQQETAFAQGGRQRNFRSLVLDHHLRSQEFPQQETAFPQQGSQVLQCPPGVFFPQTQEGVSLDTRQPFPPQVTGFQQFAVSPVPQEAPIACGGDAFPQQDSGWTQSSCGGVYMPDPCSTPDCFDMPEPCDSAQLQGYQDNANFVLFYPQYMPVGDANSGSMPAPLQNGPAPGDWGVPQHDHGWKQEAPLPPKEFAGAVRPNDMVELKFAVQQAMTATSKRGTSRNSSSTGEGLSDDLADGSDDLATPKRQCSNAAPKPSAEVAEVSGLKSLKCQRDPSLPHDIELALINLDSHDEQKRLQALQWVTEVFWPLTLSKKGCHVVQKAMDMGSWDYNLHLLENLRGHVVEASQSPHANYVVQKFIKIVSPEKIQFVVEELQERSVDIARHRFGCRILQRLLESCPPCQTERVINDVLAEAVALCKHTFGNFMLQHILQYGTPPQRSVIAQVLLADVMRLSKHPVASHIVSAALVHCSPDDIQALVDVVRSDPLKVYQLSRREYGSFVVREVNRAARLLKPESDENGTMEENVKKSR